MPQEHTAPWQVWLLVYEMRPSGKHSCTWTSEEEHNDGSVYTAMKLSSFQQNNLISTEL